MGLAASQARFLAITSRKMNCEFQSMQIAQDKLSVTRDLQSAATKYQNAMNATKLVWDTDTDEVYDLSYNLLMTPSALNDYNPYLITDTQGKLVLTDTMFQAAVDAKIIDKNGDPIGVLSKGARDIFMTELAKNGEVASSTAETVIANAYTKSGIGGEILDKTIANVLTTNAFINKLGTKDDEGNPLFGVSVLDMLGISVSDGNVDAAYDSKFCYNTYPDDIYGANKGKFVISNNGSALSREQLKKLSLGDLLSGKYTITKLGSNFSAEEVQDYMLKTIAKALGYNPGSTTPSGDGLNVDYESSNALAVAYEFTKSKYTGNANSISAESQYDAINGCMNGANNYNGMVADSGGTQSLSLTNMLKSYLTNFAVAMDGASRTQFNVDTEVSKSSYVTNDVTYYFFLESENSVTETDLLITDFYNQLFNQLCVNGATTDSIKRDMINDPEYLMQALKNGQLFISSLNTDGYFYQGAYTLNGYVAEVTDEEAIAQAEMEYELTKTKLNYKEETLDVKMKNIDTELSALTTEYDTVKNLISKNVEKVFTMFST